MRMEGSFRSAYSQGTWSQGDNLPLLLGHADVRVLVDVGAVAGGGAGDVECQAAEAVGEKVVSVTGRGDGPVLLGGAGVGPDGHVSVVRPGEPGGFHELAAVDVTDLVIAVTGGDESPLLAAVVEPRP